MVSLMIEHIRSAKYWVFDLDGTLTLPVHDFEHIRLELGLPVGCDILATIEAKPDPEQRRLNHQLDLLEYFYAEQVVPAEGIKELLGSLVQSGCHLGVLTRNKRDVALHCLEKMGVHHLFSNAAVLGRDEAIAKPDPEGINILLGLWRAEPGDAVMVGDFRYDLEVGRAAGLATVHVDQRPGRDWPELTDLKVTSLVALNQWLGF